MDEFTAYIPMDRRQSISKGIELPKQTNGAGLFADISGFTPLTEALAKELGPQRGAEELTHHLNQVYNALIGVLHNYGGSVIGFSGDAITCWFSGDTGLNAVACGLAMQVVMEQFSNVETASGQKIKLSMKAAVASGPARRFIVGDPEIQIIDVVSGATLDRLSDAEHQAERGEVILDPLTLNLKLHDIEYTQRVRSDTGEVYGVVSKTLSEIKPTPWADLSTSTFSEAQIRPWVLPPVYERLRSGQGEFLAELRPAVALFLRFIGIDFENDQFAEQKLDEFVRKVQHILTKYEGTLIQLTIGDKGSYLYSAFGAPLAHENDPVRSANVALELMQLAADLDYITGCQIGITRGRMRTGAYGSTNRRTYGVLGDAVNLSARLMQAANPSQILVDQKIYESIKDRFEFEALPDIQVKGKSGDIVVYGLLGSKEQRYLHLLEQRFTLPLVGRGLEMNLSDQVLNSIGSGNGKFLGISAEAGMGKTRLIVEILRKAEEFNFVTYGGECLSYGANISYLVWQNIWRNIFGIEADWGIEEQSSFIKNQLFQVDPNFVARLPLVGAVLNIPFPDNELTSNMDSKLRKSSLESLLVEYLRSLSKLTPIIIVLEDCQWLDPLSLDLLEAVGRIVANQKLLIILTFRQLESSKIRLTNIQSSPHYNEIKLLEFNEQEAEQLIQIKLAQHFGTIEGLSNKLVKKINSRAQGNPYYIEETINYFKDNQINPQNITAVDKADLPASLHSLVLSRIDQLNEMNKITLKFASVIGRSFEHKMLSGIFQGQKERPNLQTSLDALIEQDFIILESGKDERYAFKNQVMQEATYESLPYKNRSVIHGQIGDFIEITYPDRLDQFIDILALHFDRSSNLDKRKQYLYKAGEAAQTRYANEAAIDYYLRVIPLLDEQDRPDAKLNIGKVFERIGNWDEAENQYQQALDLTERFNDLSTKAWCQTAIGELFRKQGQYQEAANWLKSARSVFETLNDKSGVGQILHFSGTLAAQQGEFDSALSHYQESLEIRRQLDDKPNIGSLLSNMGVIARYQGNDEYAYTLYKESLDIRREVGDKWAIAISLNNLGNTALKLGQAEEARSRLVEALALQKEVGDLWYIGNALNNLANVARDQGNYIESCSLYRESLSIYRDLMDKWALAFLLEDIGGAYAQMNMPFQALQLVGAAAGLREEIDSPLPPADQEKLESMLTKARQSLNRVEQELAWGNGHDMPLEKAINLALYDECT